VSVARGQSLRGEPGEPTGARATPDDDACHDDDHVVGLLEGAFDDEAWLDFDAHLDGCERCRRLVGLAVDDAGEEAAADPSVLPLLHSGATLSRYVILGLIGSGGMGAVYAAYDPELDRKVAVKLLWPDHPDAGGTEEKRVLREARAMARLTHPNVVAVYDVGVVDGRVFLVMEFVRGTTLRAWLAEARPWREVISVFRRAGNGLSAAHAAGLVHRDFKPENVLVDPAGRVLVTDFGLARPAGGGPQAPGASAALAVDRVSRTGVIAGTPAYMAPEQLDGAAADFGSDVFSFCVALYEALYGERPFPGDTMKELRHAIARGQVRDPPKDARVPAWVRHIVLRGLVPEPSLRPSSVDELTAALAHDAGASIRRRVAFGLAALAVAGIVLALLLPPRTQQMVCRGGEGKLAGVWNAERRRTVSSAILASGGPGSAGAARVVEGVLDRYAQGWAAMRREACEATHVAHEQSEALLDARMRCLDARLEELRRLTQLLSTPDEALHTSAPRAVYSLSSLRRCADAEALLSPVPPPADPSARAEVERLRLALAEVKAMTALGRYRESEELAADLAARTRPLGYAPLDAEVLEVWGELLELTADYPRAADTLREALRAAESGRDRQLAARVLTRLDWVAGARQGEFARAHEYGGHAAAIVRGLGGDIEIEALLARSEGATFLEEDRYDESAQAMREALEKQEAVSGTAHPRTGWPSSTWGTCSRNRSSPSPRSICTIARAGCSRRRWATATPSMATCSTSLPTISVASAAPRRRVRPPSARSRCWRRCSGPSTPAPPGRRDRWASWPSSSGGTPRPRGYSIAPSPARRRRTARPTPTSGGWRSTSGARSTGWGATRRRSATTSTRSRCSRRAVRTAPRGCRRARGRGSARRSSRPGSPTRRSPSSRPRSPGRRRTIPARESSATAGSAQRRRCGRRGETAIGPAASPPRPWRAAPRRAQSRRAILLPREPGS
jgi:hypothetical protein